MDFADRDARHMANLRCLDLGAIQRDSDLMTLAFLRCRQLESIMLPQEGVPPEQQVLLVLLCTFIPFNVAFLRLSLISMQFSAVMSLSRAFTAFYIACPQPIKIQSTRTGIIFLDRHYCIRPAPTINTAFCFRTLCRVLSALTIAQSTFRPDAMAWVGELRQLTRLAITYELPAPLQVRGAACLASQRASFEASAA